MTDLDEFVLDDAWEWRKRQAEIEDDRKTQELLAVEHRTDWKPAPRLTRADAYRKHRPSIAWKLAVLERDQGCCVHTNPAECRNGWESHHVTPQQHLRRERPDVLWHPLTGMGVCGLAHRQHHNRVRPIRYTEIPTPVLDFLSGLGFGVYLERHYP